MTIQKIGYHGIEISLDPVHYHPYSSPDSALRELKRTLQQTGFRNVVATGARYVLGPVKHEPSIISKDPEDRKRWNQFLKDSILLAKDLGSECVMLHSGYLQEGVNPKDAWGWMVETLNNACQTALSCGQKLALEFHPDMFIRTYDDYVKLKKEIPFSNFGLTLDIGHVACTETVPQGELIRKAGKEIFNVHLDDIKGNLHKHLPVGRGDIDFKSVFEALSEIEYKGLASVEYNSNDGEEDERELAERAYCTLLSFLPESFAANR
jgi:sugar phosphate isomerase/epimerase